jgi:hypothetical protein
MAENRKGPNSEVQKPAPGTILPVKAFFLAISDKEAQFESVTDREIRPEGQKLL